MAPNHLVSIYFHEALSGGILNKDDMNSAIYMFFQKSFQMIKIINCNLFADKH